MPNGYVILSPRSSRFERYRRDNDSTDGPPWRSYLHGELLIKQREIKLIENAVSDFGYSQMELAIFLTLHYSTISRILTATSDRKSKDPGSCSEGRVKQLYRVWNSPVRSHCVLNRRFNATAS